MKRKILIDAVKLDEAIHLLKRLGKYDSEVEIKLGIKTSLELINGALSGGEDENIVGSD